MPISRDHALQLAAEGAGPQPDGVTDPERPRQQQHHPAKMFDSDCWAAIPSSTLVRAVPTTSWPTGTRTAAG